MRGKRYSEEQIVAIIKEGASGMPLAELLRKHGIADVLPPINQAVNLRYFLTHICSNWYGVLYFSAECGKSVLYL